MAGTGGKMSMLSAHTGLGGGNQGKQHDENFQEIARSRAAEISEMFQRQFDTEILGVAHEGEPVLVYFELAPEENVDVDSLVKNVVSLAGAGKAANVAWLNEQTGYDLEDQPLATEQIKEEKPSGGKPETGNLKPEKIANRALVELEALADAGNDEIEERLALFNREFPGLAKILNGGGNPWHDQKGLFTSPDGPGFGGGVGEIKTWKDYGLADARELNPRPALDPVEPEIARERLKVGINLTDPLGNKISLNEHVFEHWDAEKQTSVGINHRLRRLDEAIATLEHPHEIWEGDKQKIYLSVFEDGKKNRYLAGFVMENNKVRTFFHHYRTSRFNEFRKGKLLYPKE